MKRYFLEIQFDGTAYHGWQVQPNALSVQEVMEDRLRKLTGDENIRVNGCGRTDTSVHAKQFFLHFDTEATLLENFVFRMNSFLPEDIVCRSLGEATKEQHARFDAISRTYQYHVHREKQPFKRSYSYYFRPELDLELMNKASKALLGKQDFSCFSKSNTQTRTNLCELSEAFWQRKTAVLYSLFLLTGSCAIW